MSWKLSNTKRTMNLADSRGKDDPICIESIGINYNFHLLHNFVYMPLNTSHSHFSLEELSLFLMAVQMKVQF